MTKEFLQKVKELIKSILAAKPDFYRKKLSSAGIDEAQLETLNESDWNLIPILTKQELANAPYASRCYGEKPGLNKLIFSEEADQYFLIHRTLEEIRQERLPYDGTRPMAIFSNVYEAIERCLYFYEQNVLPLIGEFHNPAVIYATARQYKVDTIFMDRAAIRAFREKLLEILPALKSVTVIDDTFSAEDFEWPADTKLSFVLSIPEIGGVAYACPESIAKKDLVFHPADNVYIEPSALSIITAPRLKACPMLRYRSHLYFEKTPPRCACQKISFKI